MDEVLTTQGVADRGLELVGQSKDLIVSALDTRAGKDGDFPDVVKQLDQLTDVLRVRLDSRPTTRDENREGAAAFLSEMSPGRVITETVLPATAWRMAEFMTRGACSGVETSSQ